MKSPILDVIVVGGGPAGLYSALLLAEEGFDVTVLEEHGALGVPTHCTGVISDELSDLFKVPETAILSRPTVCFVVSPSGRAVPFTSDNGQIAVMDRGQFDAELGAAAQRAGAQIQNGFRVERIQHPEPGYVRVIGPGDASLSARVCILACGVGYRLQRQLGLGLPPLLLHSAQVEVDVEGAELSDAVELYVGKQIAPEGFAWMVPVTRDGRARMKVGLMARGDAGTHLARFLSQRSGPSERIREPGAVIRRLLPLAPLARTYGRRVLVVGDAAGLTKPTTGGGIFYSLLSAFLAAETLTEALRRNHFGEDDLRAYETRWRARLGPHLWISTYVRRLFTMLTDRELETLLEALASDQVQKVIRRTAKFNWHGEILRSVLRQRGIKSLLFRAVLR